MSILEPEPEEEPTEATEDMKDLVDWASIMPVVPDYSTGDFNIVPLLETPELVSRYHEITSELKRRGELLSQRTDTGRDLQSERGAIRIEMDKRNLL